MNLVGDLVNYSHDNTESVGTILAMGEWFKKHILQ